MKKKFVIAESPPQDSAENKICAQTIRHRDGNSENRIIKKESPPVFTEKAFIA